MKHTVLKNYNRMAALLWFVFGAILLLQATDYLPLLPSLALVAAVLPFFWGGATFLTNVLLPKAIAKRKMGRFCIHFILVSFVVAMLFGQLIQCFRYLEDIAILPPSEIFDDTREHFWEEAFDNSFTILLINLAFCGLRFYYEHTKFRETHLDAQLRMLQAQVNPHFMFNVLNHIHILIRKDVDKAEYLLEKYSDILRFQLYNSKDEYITLHQEIAFLKNIISVERLRWGDTLAVNCRWDIDNPDKKTEPLLFIPFVENAFKYVPKSITENGYINLSFAQHGNNILFSIENNKPKYKDMHTNKSSSGLGIQNIRQRLGLLYPDKHTLHITETETTYHVALCLNL